TLVMGARPKLLSIFTHALSRMIHFCPLTPCMCQLGVRNVGLNDRWRLKSPYLEHFSQAFARLFMRVGLPSAIPPF
ncbi:MAG: hypothetical protein ACBR12_21120, partial [Microcoleus sp.]